MKSLYQQLLEKISTPASRIKAIHIHSDVDNPSAKFGAIELDDGAIGITYTKLGDAYSKLQNAELWRHYVGKEVTELAQIADMSEAWQQVLGAGAINALSQQILRQRGFNYSKAEDSLDLLDLKKGDHIGMVGYFTSLTEQLRQEGYRVTVIELRQDLLQQQDNFEVTDDPSSLAQCDKVLITGTSVINHTLDNLLSHCSNAKAVALVGPSVGLLPELLFTKGITSIGGRAVIDSEKFLQRWQSGEKWKDCVVRYSLRQSDYSQ